jgi:hypothetical protein
MSEKDRDKKPPCALFEDWIAGATIYIGRARYGWPGVGFVAASCYDKSEQLREAVENLAGDDQEASDAADVIEQMNCFYACDPDPAIAMQKLMGKMRDFQRVIDQRVINAIYLNGKKDS